MDSTSNVRGVVPLIIATGGTPCAGATCGDYKVHKFTGPGTFCVSQVSPCAANNVVSYLVVAGGGSAQDAGAGAGGFREYKNSCDPYTASPLDGNPGGTAITVTASPYSITVGAGATFSPGTGAPGNRKGSDSVFSTITSTGGGGGSTCTSPFSPTAGLSGGSGGGIRGTWANPTIACRGNNPPTTPAQGNSSGTSDASGGAGGGGATTAGNNYPGPHIGGTGATTSITATPTGYAGGGSGTAPGIANVGREPTNTGGAGISGSQGAPGTQCGVINTGGGGGGVWCGTNGAGGSGLVVIRYKFQ